MATQNFNDTNITGDHDVTQLKVKGWTTQNQLLQDWQDSTSASKASMDNAGKLTVSGFKMATGAQSGYILQSDACGESKWVPGPGAITTSGVTCNGRLTLESGVAISTTDQTAETTLYFTPFRGNQVALYSGQWWTNYPFSELSLSVPSTSNTTYDVFIYDNAGTLTLQAVSWNAPDNGSVTSISNANPPVVTVSSHTLVTNQLVTIAGNSVAANNGTWRVGTTTATTFTLIKLDGTNPGLPGSVGTGGTWQRADQNPARVTALTKQDGIYVKSGEGNTIYRYLGTIRTTDVLGQCEDSEKRRYVWNYSNRVLRKLKRQEIDWWTYAVSTWRIARNDFANRVELVVGVDEDVLTSTVMGYAYSVTGVYGSNGIGLDVTANYASVGNSAQLFAEHVNTSASSTVAVVPAFWHGYPGSGYHSLSWLERRGAGTVTFYGSLADRVQSGLAAEMLG